MEYDANTVPPSITDKFDPLLLLADVMFVCGLPFLVTISRGLKFMTVQYVPRRTATDLGSAIKSVIHI